MPMDVADVCRVAANDKRRKRLGRGNGSGKGKTCGRGHGGACSRSGFRRRWFAEGGQMPLYRRLPKKGFSNAGFRSRYDVVNVGQLAAFEAGTHVTLAFLEEQGLLKARHGRLKVLGGGELGVSLKVTAAHFSGAAREKITQAGGTAEVVG
jgi:large subunit ribosomal protein L15